MEHLGGRRIALLFPGQGSQWPGMGRALHRRFASARQVFVQADEILGLPITRLCCQGDTADLAATNVTQPATFVVSIACLRALEELAAEAGMLLRSVLVAGHSVGHFSALVAAGSVEFEPALRAVAERARAMQMGEDRRPGAMAALVGLDADAVLEVCRRCRDGGVLTIACYNAPDQHVIAGDRRCVDRAVPLAIQRGARRARVLMIGVASHCPLMEEAQDTFRSTVEALEVRAPLVPVALNATGALATTAEAIREDLRWHMSRPIRWVHSLETAREAGVDCFLEVGPGQVLTRLVQTQMAVPSVSLCFVQPLEELVTFRPAPIAEP